jgi:replicative DNA helicase
LLRDELMAAELPQNYEAEVSVLGSILLDNTAFDAAESVLRGDEFYDARNARIYRAMCEMREAGEPIDLVTLTDQLIKRGELETVGGVDYLARLESIVPTATNIEYYAGIVRERHLKRAEILMLREALQKAMQGDGEAGQIAAAVQDKAMSILEQSAAAEKTFQPIGEVAVSRYEEIERRAEAPAGNGVTGLPTGYPDLDRMTTGFQRSDLIIVAARPSVGKTAFALNIAANVGIRARETVGIFSLEMSDKQLVDRMICAEANVDAGKLRTGRLDPEDWVKVATAISQLNDAPIYIDDTPALTVQDIRIKARRLQREHGLGLIIVDYLQLVQTRRRGENRQQEVSEISRTLKQIARELNVPVIALSQLSRAVEQRQDKRPMLSDLRESGSIEQDADVVAFLYRDDYYDKETERKNIIEIIIAKQRNGPVGTVELVFLKNFNKFVSLDRGHSEQPARRSEPDERRRWA